MEQWNDRSMGGKLGLKMRRSRIRPAAYSLRRS
jgi:hypothetical protein